MLSVENLWCRAEGLQAGFWAINNLLLPQSLAMSKPMLQCISSSTLVAGCKSEGLLACKINTRVRTAPGSRHQVSMSWSSTWISIHLKGCLSKHTPERILLRLPSDQTDAPTVKQKHPTIATSTTTSGRAAASKTGKYDATSKAEGLLSKKAHQPTEWSREPNRTSAGPDSLTLSVDDMPVRVPIRLLGP